MIGSIGECGVVDKSTPQYDAIKSNSYVHICTINYLYLMEMVV